VDIKLNPHDRKTLEFETVFKATIYVFDWENEQYKVVTQGRGQSFHLADGLSAYDNLIDLGWQLMSQ
jgi:hypothetical protein